MNRFVVLASVSLVATILVQPRPAATRGLQQDADRAVQGAGGLPAGWQARLDSGGASLDAVKFMTMGTGLHATTGPAGRSSTDRATAPAAPTPSARRSPR